MARAGSAPPAPDIALTRPVVLVGMMGSGKTTVGKKVASKLRVPFVDTDAEIERRSGRSVAELFADDGEPSFRATESALLAEVIESREPKIVATGGGAVLAERNRRLLHEHATVIWLHATAGVLAHRVRGDATRPLLDGADPRATIARLLDERDDAYRSVADAIVDVDMAERKVVVARVLDAIVAAGASTPNDPSAAGR